MVTVGNNGTGVRKESPQKPCFVHCLKFHFSAGGPRLGGACSASRPCTAASDDVTPAVLVVAGAVRCKDVAALAFGWQQLLATVWQVEARRLDVAEAPLHLVVGPPTVFGNGQNPFLVSRLDKGPLHAWGARGGTGPVLLAIVSGKDVLPTN